MVLSNKEIKQRHFNKVYSTAESITCACGCGKILLNKDKYGRDIKFINGHNNRKYEDSTQYKREWNYRNREKRQIYKMIYYHRKKSELIIYKGGKCVNCDLKYTGKNGSVFQFHHKEPKDKLFQLGNQLTNHKWEKVIQEVDKCDLLCANCHSLRHSEEF
jgi:hypothetical protein